MKIHNFKNSWEASIQGTNIVIEWMKNLPNLIELIDVQNDPFYQKKDIDFIIKRKPCIEHHIEIKVDSYFYKSNNIFWETMSNIERNNVGCFMYSQATHFYYYFFPGDVLYIFETTPTRQWFIKNKHRFTKKTLKNKCGNNETYTSIGYIIDRKTFISENNVTVIKNISKK